MSEKSELERVREQWSEQLSFLFLASLLLAIFALVVVVVIVAVPNSIGIDHKIYILGIVGAALLCIVILLIKARNDSQSLLIWTKVSDVIAALIIGVSIGQLTRHLPVQH